MTTQGEYTKMNPRGGPASMVAYTMHNHRHSHPIQPFGMKEMHPQLQHSHAHRPGFGEHHDHREEPDYQD